MRQQVDVDTRRHGSLGAISVISYHSLGALLRADLGNKEWQTSKVNSEAIVILSGFLVQGDSSRLVRNDPIMIMIEAKVFIDE